MVFLSTAVSQSGRLDALLVFGAQTRLVWQIAHLYWQRPHPRDLVQLYANIFITVFLAHTLDDLDVHEVVTPVLGPVFASAGIGAIPGAGGIATVVADALLEGTVNALLTLRVGCMSRRYCASATAFDRRHTRRSATREAAALLPGVVGQAAGIVTAAIWAAAKQSGIMKAATALGEMVGNATEAVTATVAGGAQSVTITVVQAREAVATTVKGAAQTIGHQVSEVTHTVTTNATILTQGLATTMVGLAETVTVSHPAAAITGQVTAVRSAATEAGRKLWARTPWGTAAEDSPDVAEGAPDPSLPIKMHDFPLERAGEETHPPREGKEGRQPTDVPDKPPVHR
jgi:hypothetical protein